LLFNAVNLLFGYFSNNNSDHVYFSFWFRITISNPDSSLINVTNIETGVRLFDETNGSSSSNNNSISIDIGIWEVKSGRDMVIKDMTYNSAKCFNILVSVTSCFPKTPKPQRRAIYERINECDKI